MNNPIKLLPERAWRKYLGGKLIDELHGNFDTKDTSFPEEWLMSTVKAINHGREDIVEGLSHTENGETLASLIEKYPKNMLGEKHFAKYGAKTGVLVKILDSAVRLGVQVHPTRAKAKQYFGSDFGKTECWYIIGKRKIEGEDDPCVYIGFKEGITKEKWEKCFYEEDIPTMLGCLNKVPVEIGDTILVRGGVPHAIGAGCLLVEIQEPTDYTLRTERHNFDGSYSTDEACHYGAGFEAMFDCFDYDGLSLEGERKKSGIAPIKTEFDGYSVTRILKYSDTPMFRMELVEVSESCIIEENDVFSGMYILSGKGSFAGAFAEKGDQFFLPASCDKFEIVNLGSEPMKIMRYYGPEV